jgi:hypothetical protein
MGNITTLNMTTLDGGNVIIKKGEGGGSTPPSGEESASTIEYFDFSEGLNESWATFLILSCIEVKGYPTLNGQSVKVLAPANVYKTLAGELLSIRQATIDFSMPIIISAGGQTQTATVADFLIQQGATQEKLDALPRITKEEFYKLD